MTRRLACALVLTAALGPSFGQSTGAHRYAVISTVGDELSVVQENQSVGSMLDRNDIQRVPLKDSALDRAALLAARKVIQSVEPGASVTLLAVSEAELPPPHRIVDDKNHFAPPPELAAELAKDHVTHVVLLTNSRGEAAFTTADGWVIGHGKVEGVGFYVDRRTHMRSGSTLERGVGFLSPFAYVTVSLATVGDGTVLRSQPVHESMVIAASDARQSADPWDALSAPQKVQALQQMLSDGVAAVLPSVLAPH